MEPALWELYESGPADEEVSVIIRMAPGADAPPVVRVVSRFDDIHTARVRRADIVLARQAPGVISLKASSPVTLPRPLETSPEAFAEAEDEGEVADPVEAEAAGAEESDQAAGRRGPGDLLPDIPEDGRGVVVGICDWGFDFTHPNFRNEDGTTRLLSLWDQRGDGDPLAPQPYGHGRVLTREMINAALASANPCETLDYHPASADPTDSGAHGTHVADILAGNRREPGSEVGLASGADIVFVHLASTRLRELGNLGDSVALLEGLDFCRRQAAGRPCVLHLSAGKTGGEKRGQSPLERAVDTMLKEPGIVLVQSVGNYAQTAMHTQARIGPDQHHVIHWIVPRRDPTPNALEVWYSGEDVFEAALVAPDGRRFSVPLDDRVPLGDDVSSWGSFYHRRHEPNSGLNHIAVYLYSAAPGGKWDLALHGRDIVDGRLHAWIERDASRRYQSRFTLAQATSRYTTNTICNCFRAIAVGAYDATSVDRRAAPFSSRGPTADGRQKPEIAAPGYMIRAARSTPRNGWRPGESRLCKKSGTSMAAPWVSGTVALMMQAAGRPLTVHEIRRALIGSADPHPGPSGRSSTKLGYGYLNTAAAVAAARRLALPGDARSRAVPGREDEATEGGWAPIWVEDAVVSEEFETAALPEVASEDGGRAGAVSQSSEDASGTRGIESRPATVLADPEDEGGDEPEAWEGGEDTEEPIAESFETPFGWEDVRDAIEAVEQIESNEEVV